MPRNRSAGRPAPARSAPTRPTVGAPSSAHQQQRPATTMAAPQQAYGQRPPAGGAAAAGPQASQGPGLFGQMASTAAGVAIGSSVGHAIGGFFGGGSAEAAAPQEQQSLQSQQQQQQGYGNNNYNCQGATQAFTKCMDEQQGNMQICNWYLEQLKACQAAASQY